MKNWDNVVLVPEFDEQGVACYRLEGGDYENEYYVISEAESRKLLNTPEIVGYESLLTPVNNFNVPDDLPLSVCEGALPCWGRGLC